MTFPNVRVDIAASAFVCEGFVFGAMKGCARRLVAFGLMEGSRSKQSARKFFNSAGKALAFSGKGGGCSKAYHRSE
jgi:hypothetical protein